MAEVATAETVQDQEVDFTNLTEDLDERLEIKQGRMKDAKVDYDQICKTQNDLRGYHKKGMNWLTTLRGMSVEKRQDVMRTLMPGLEILNDLDMKNEPDFLDNGAEIHTLNTEEPHVAAE